jgi:hypothetical protein
MLDEESRDEEVVRDILERFVSIHATVEGAESDDNDDSADERSGV